MSVAAAQAEAFYTEVARDGLVFTVRDDGGIPAPMTSSGQRSMPFWSKRSRAQKIVDNVEAYAGMRIVEIVLDDWLAKWLAGLETDGLLAGLNWSGRNAVGYDVAPADAARNLAARRGHRDASRAIADE